MSRVEIVWKFRLDWVGQRDNQVLEFDLLIREVVGERFRRFSFSNDASNLKLAFPLL